LLCHDPSRRKHHPTSDLAVNQPFVLNMFSQKPKYAASGQLGQKEVDPVIIDTSPEVMADQPGRNGVEDFAQQEPAR
jgi:hypothetical protein